MFHLLRHCLSDLRVFKGTRFFTITSLIASGLVCALTNAIALAQEEQNASAASSQVDVASLDLPSPPSAEALLQGRSLIIGTAPVSGVYYPAGGALCRALQVDAQRHGLRCFVESTSGSEENLNGLMQDRLDLGIVQSDWHYFAVKGLASFAGSGNNERLRSLFALHHEDIALVVRPFAGILSLEDLKGKRVNFGPEGSGQRAITEILLGAVNISRDNLSMIASLETTAQARAFCADQIDAFFLPVVTPSYAVAEVVNGCEGKIVPLNGPEIEELLSSNPFFVRSTIPAAAYGGLDEDIGTFGLRATVMTTVDLPDDIAYEVVASVFERFNTFRSQHLAFRGLLPERTLKGGLSAPIHEGAQRYFKEKGFLP